jgi:hypothetical protein
MEPARPRAGRDRDEGVPAPTFVRIQLSDPVPPAAAFASESKEFSDFLKCPASKSLERDETNQINNRYDEHGSRQPHN